MSPPQISLTKNPPAGYHFQVVFFIGGLVPNPLDIRFQKVSGLNVSVDTEDSVANGGENIFVQNLPKHISYDNLVLERGVVIGSLLAVEFNLTMSTFKFFPSNVLVVALNEHSIPVTGWLFFRAYPVKWSISDLDATQNALIVETMELTYTRFQSLRI
ncbi:MAG: phage tail protein [Deltaproteobacteria bacterium]|nr:phage tail protein [Deltaproteobacteria bacterium]